MPPTHLTALAELNAQTLKLEEVQLTIDTAVIFAQKTNADESYFAQLYRAQLEVDRQHSVIESLKESAARNN